MTNECAEDAGFWRFSLGFYAQPKVPEICLALQDRHGCDVTLVLFALWGGLSSGRLSDDAAAAARTLSAAWRARAVQPLRALRRDLKRGVPEADGAIAVEAFRERVKALELAAEHAQQQALEPLRGRCAGPAGAAAARANFIALAQPGAAAAPLFEQLLDLATKTGGSRETAGFKAPK